MYASHEEMGLDVERLGIVIPGIAAIIRGYPLGAEPLQLTTFIPNTKETLRLFDFFPITLHSWRGQMSPWPATSSSQTTDQLSIVKAIENSPR